MTPAHSTAVAAALTDLDEDSFVRNEHGDLLAQSTAGWAIAQALDRLEVRPGMRVLEIGTGSGYSTALLATLVGPSGHVISLDVVPDLVDRARHRLAMANLHHVTLHCADGATGSAPDAPFDRVVAWTTAPELPASWIEQLAPVGLVVAPVALTSLSKTGAGVVVALDGSSPRGCALFQANYVEMHDHVLTQWDVPPYGADSVRLDAQDRWWWLSAEHFRSTAGAAVGHALLEALICGSGRVGGPLRADESVQDFRSWLLAARPGGLTTAALGRPLWRIGYSDPEGAALVSTVDGTDTITIGNGSNYEVVVGWAEDWRRAGRPGIDSLRPNLTRTTTGWLVRARSAGVSR